MDIATSGGEDAIQLYDDYSFISKQDVAVGETHKYAYQIEGPDNYIIAIDAGTIVAPDFVDTSSARLDDSTVLWAQKADRQGNKLGNAIVFEDTLDVFDYEKMRSDKDYFRYTHKAVVLDEGEFLNFYLDLPTGSNDFDASQSRLTIGDKSTRLNQPVYIREKNTLNAAQQQAVNGGGGR